MDIFAHALWGYTVFRKKALTKWAIAMTVMPDFFSFGIYFIILLATGKLFSGQGFGTIPHYVTFMYNATHSLFIAGIFGIFVYMRYREYMLLIWGWLMHIGIDIFSHAEGFFPTQILYPVSNIHFSFIRWSDPVFMIVNYSALLVIYSILGIRWWRRKKKP